MKVQEISTPKGKRYIVLDNEYNSVIPVNRYLKYLDNIGKSPNTQRGYAHDLLLYLRFLEQQNIDLMKLCMDPDNGPIEILSRFMLWLQYPDYNKGVLHIQREECIRSNTTVNHTMSAVLEFYSFLAKNGEIKQLDVYRMQMMGGKFKSFLYELVNHKTKIMSSIFKKPTPKGPVQAVTREQFKLLADACNNRRDKLLLSLLFEGGLRLNEALGIHLCDVIEIEDKIIHIVARENNENGARVKRNAEGIIYLPDYVVDLLVDYINIDIIDYESDYLFLNLFSINKGAPLRDKSVEQLFIRLRKKTGLDVHPHMLRHGFAQEKLESGWPLEQIQAYLRHRNPSSTEIYAQYNDALKIQKMQEFEQLHDYSKEAAIVGKNNQYRD